MKKNNTLIIFLFLFNIANASENCLSMLELSKIEKEPAMVNQKIKEQKTFFANQKEVYNDIDQIKIMAYEASILKDEIIKKYENKECLAVLSEIKDLKEELVQAQAKAKHYKVFENDIREVKQMLILANDRLAQCKK